MSERAGVLGRLGVEPGERRIFAWAGLCLLLMGASAFAVLNSAETLFLKRVGVEYIPLAMLASSALLVVTTGLLGRQLQRVDRTRWLPRVLLCLALLLLPFAVLARWDSVAVFVCLILVSRQILAIGLLSFFIALGDLVTGRQAKRLYAPLTAGITIGGIIGSFGTEPVARLVGVPGVLACGAVLLVGAALMANRLRAARPRRLEVAGGDAAQSDARSRATRVSDENPVKPRELWRESRLFRLLLVALLCGGTLSPVLYFQFSYVADAATSGPGGEQALLGLFAQFRGWLNVAMLGAQLWVSGRLYRRLGLPLSLAIWPATYLVGFGWLGAQLTLRPGLLSLGGARLAEDGVAAPALRVLFNLFPERFRSRASALLEGPVNRLGGMLGNGGVLILLAIGGVHWVAFAAMPVAALWLLSALILWRAYPAILLQASARQNLAESGDADQLLDPGTVRALSPSLSDPDPRTVRVALDLLADADPAATVPYVAEAVENAGTETRPVLVAALHRWVEPLAPGALHSRRAAEALDRVLARPGELPAEQRSDLLQVYARLTGGANADSHSYAALDSALGDREAAVRLAAIAELHRRHTPPPGVSDLDTALSQAISGKDVLMRRTARRELRAMLLSTEPDAVWDQRLSLLTQRLDERADRADTAEALVEIARRHNGAARPSAPALLLRADDRDPRVRAAALSFFGHAGVSEEATRLISALGSRVGEEARAARDGLVALGPAGARELLTESEFGTPAQRAAVLEVMAELDVDPATLLEHFEAQHHHVCRLLLQRQALGADHPATLLVRRVEERVQEGVSGLVLLLSVIHDDGRIAELDQRIRRTRDERRHDILVEALDALLSPVEGRQLLPLVELGAWERRARFAGQALAEETPSAEDALRELAADPDETTQLLAEAYTTRLAATVTMGDPSGVLDSTDLAVRLQSVPVFNRLSTRQLMRLAEHLQEERHEPGGAVFREGDEGTGLYFVLEGQVELRSGEQVVDRVGPDRFFGELATLDGVPRSLSAVAASSLHILRLDREDLLGLMEEAPALGIGLAQLLALRVRELQERLQERP